MTSQLRPLALAAVRPIDIMYGLQLFVNITTYVVNSGVLGFVLSLVAVIDFIPGEQCGFHANDQIQVPHPFRQIRASPFWTRMRLPVVATRLERVGPALISPPAGQTERTVVCCRYRL